MNESETFSATGARVHAAWHAAAVARDTERLVALYARDAVLESPLVPAVLDVASGVLCGHAALRAFFDIGARSRPLALVRWHRSGRFLTDGVRLLAWEYPRATPAGEQIDLLEMMEIDAGLIARHRIYWGWFGVGRLVERARRQGAENYSGIVPSSLSTSPAR